MPAERKIHLTLFLNTKRKKVTCSRPILSLEPTNGGSLTPAATAQLGLAIHDLI